jgi:hypothetical protein
LWEAGKRREEEARYSVILHGRLVTVQMRKQQEAAALQKLAQIRTSLLKRPGLASPLTLKLSDVL